MHTGARTKEPHPASLELPWGAQRVLRQRAGELTSLLFVPLSLSLVVTDVGTLFHHHEEHCVLSLHNTVF